MTKKKTYESSLLKLREIVEIIQSDDISIDDLGKNVKLAEELLAECKAKLRGIESEINSIKNPKN